MRTLFRRLTTRDPTTFIGTFAAWAIACGCGLIFTDDTFSRSPMWAGVQSINPDDTLWGILMVLNGLMLFLALRLHKIPTRAAITLFSSIAWLWLGISLTLNGMKGDVLSIVGPFSIWCSIQAWFAVGRWVQFPLEDQGNGVR